jgi:hypothetical protein
MKKDENVIIEDNENWKEIEGYGDKYEISDSGHMRNKIIGKICPEQTTQLGYKRVILYHNSKKTYIGIHYLVAKYFFDNLDNKEYVAHLDGNFANNRTTNLKWVDEKEKVVIDYMYKNNLADKEIYQYNSDKTFVKKWKNIYEVHLAYVDYDLRQIMRCLNEEMKMSYNFIWRYEALDKEEIVELDGNNEKWKPMKGYEGRYVVSDMGRVKNLLNNKILKPRICKDSYYYISLFDGVKDNSLGLNKIIANHFIQREDPRAIVLSYKDGDPFNNKADNLEWVLPKKYRPVIKIEKQIEVTYGPDENWRDIKGYEGLYKVSFLGRIKNKKGQIRKQTIINRYLTVGLCKNGISKTKRVNIIVARAFIPNPDNKPVADHIDDNKLNNRVDNLRWLTHSRNSQEYVDNFKEIKYRKIDQYDLDNNLIKEWNSIKDIMKENNYTRSPIALCLNGAREKGYGYIWKYKENVVKNDDIELQADEEFKNVGVQDRFDFSDYECSNYGNIWSYKTNQYLAPGNSTDYESITIYDEVYKIKHSYSIHQLVALLFVNANPEEGLVVNHIDENKHNNYYKNLEWRTYRGNAEHSFGVAVEQIDIITGKCINAYTSIANASRALNKKKGGSISLCCLGKAQTAFGYKWKYKEN